MSKDIKKSTKVGLAGGVAAIASARSTVSEVTKASAATVILAASGTAGAAPASLAGASGAAITSGMTTIGGAVLQVSIVNFYSGLSNLFSLKEYL